MLISNLSCIISYNGAVVVLRPCHEMSCLSIDHRYAGWSVHGGPDDRYAGGANIQLIYLGWISAGGTMPSNTIVAGIFGTAMTILSGADPTMAVTFAIPFSMFGLLLEPGIYDSQRRMDSSGG